MAYNLTAEGPEQNRGYFPPSYPVVPTAPTTAVVAPTVAPPLKDFRPNITGAVSEGGGVARYKPQSVAETQQTQLLAAQMGLDLAHYKQFGLNPAKFIQQFGQYRDATTGMFKIPDVTPGALISSGGPTKGPGGIVLAAGTTPTNPINLADVQRGRIERNMPGQEFIQAGQIVSGDNNTVTPMATGAKNNFLPPYLQPKAESAAPIPQTATPAPAQPTASPVAPSVPQGIQPPGSPLTPLVPQSATQGTKPKAKGGFAGTAKLLELPYYLRNLGGTYA